MRRRRSGRNNCGNAKFPEALLAMSFGGWRGGDMGDWGRKRKRRRMFGSGELRLVLLKLIADEPRHGYDLIKAIEELTDGSYSPSPGVIYPTLSLLEDSGLIEAQETDSARKAFAATEAGIAELEEKKEEVESLIARLTHAGERQGGKGRTSVKRAMGNLFTVLGHRIARGDIDEETVNAVTAIIDEAAQKIERL
jgi:DNA-binding PadR family transcriptional regulator